jgi:hypothetical protein
MGQSWRTKSDEEQRARTNLDEHGGWCVLGDVQGRGLLFGRTDWRLRHGLPRLRRTRNVNPAWIVMYMQGSAWL